MPSIFGHPVNWSPNEQDHSVDLTAQFGLIHQFKRHIGKSYVSAWHFSVEKWFLFFRKSTDISFRKESVRSMPRSKPRSRGGRITWERDLDGSLQRLDSPALQEDGDLLVYNIDTVNAGALARHAVDQIILPPPDLEFTQQANVIFDFERIERDQMLDPVLSFLGLRDIENMAEKHLADVDELNKDPGKSWDLRKRYFLVVLW